MTNTNKIPGFILIEDLRGDDILIAVKSIAAINEGTIIDDGDRKATTEIYMACPVTFAGNNRIRTFERMEDIIKKIAEAQQ